MSSLIHNSKKNLNRLKD